MVTVVAQVTAVAWVQSLAWELPHAMCATKKNLAVTFFFFFFNQPHILLSPDNY